MQLSSILWDRRLRFLVISRGPTAEWIIHVLSDPLFLDCHAIGNDLPVDYDELGFVPLNRTCGRSTLAWCQLGNGLRIVNGGSGQWKRLRSRQRYALDDADQDNQHLRPQWWFRQRVERQSATVPSRWPGLASGTRCRPASRTLQRYPPSSVT